MGRGGGGGGGGGGWGGGGVGGGGVVAGGELRGEEAGEGKVLPHVGGQDLVNHVPSERGLELRVSKVVPSQSERGACGVSCSRLKRAMAP